MGSGVSTAAWCSKAIVLDPALDSFFPNPTNSKERITMKNRHPFVPRFAAAVPACGLILSLLPALAAAQDRSGKPSLTGNGLPEMPMTSPVENSLAY